MMQGVHAQVSKLFKRSVQNYIMTSRVVQGQQDLGRITAAERGDILRRWDGLRSDLQSFYTMKRKEKAAGKAADAQASQNRGDSLLSRSKTSRSQARHIVRQESTRLQAQEEPLKDRVDVRPPPTYSSGSSAQPSLSEEAEYEQAIQASVRDTSRGNAEEDAMIGAAMRENVRAMRQHGDLPEPPPEEAEKRGSALGEKGRSIFESKEFQIREEYQELIEQALRQSLADRTDHASLEHQGLAEVDAGSSRREVDGASTGVSHAIHGDDEAELQRAIEESRKQGGGHDVEEELRRAMAASKEDMERQATQRTEEIVLDFVKKQSLAEEEYRQQMTRRKGQAQGGGRGGREGGRRAEESSGGELANTRGGGKLEGVVGGNWSPSGSMAPWEDQETNDG